MSRIKPALVAFFALTFALSPLLVRSFDGYDPSQFPVPVAEPAIQPAGYAFAIWGIIYLWLLAHAAFGLWRRAEAPDWDAPRWPLIVALAVGTGWLSLANVAPVAATVAIAVMLAGALAAFLRAPDAPDRWLHSAPLAMLAGWLSAATAVSLGVVLAGYGWLSDTGSAVAMLALVLVLVVAVQRRKPRMPVYGATVIWALAGIVVTNAGSNMTVALIAGAGIVIVAVTLLAGLRRA